MKNASRVMVFMLIFGAGVLIGSRAWANPAIEEIVSRISQNGYMAYVQELEGFGTRYYFAPQNQMVADYLFDEFADFGLDASYHDFTYFANQAFQNVVATIAGTLYPDDIYIVAAHFDSTSGFPSIYAPGADDNASGTAAVMEIARVLSQYSFESTIKFIGFNLEEVLCKGSEIYADEAKARGDNILALIDLDMIAYAPKNKNDLELMGKTWLTRRIKDNAQQYTDLAAERHAGCPEGDAKWFCPGNYPGAVSVLCIEDTPEEIYAGSNPYYWGGPGAGDDTSDHLNFDFAANVVRAVAASMADLAGVITPGDADVDRDVDGSDLAEFALAFAAADSEADLNRDMVVGPEDMARFAQFYAR